MDEPAGFGGALARKYDILQQQANAATRTAISNANNTDAQTEQVAANAMSQRRLQGSQAGLYGAQAAEIAPDAQSRRDLESAQANQTRQQAAYVGPLADAQIGEQGARSRYYGQEGMAGLLNADANSRNANTNASSVGLTAQRSLNPYGRIVGGVAGQLYDATHPNGYHIGTADVISRAHAGAIYDAHPKVQEHFRHGSANVPAKGHGRAMAANSQKGQGGGLAAILPALMAAGSGAGGAGGAGGAPGAGMPQPGAGMPQPGGAQGPVGMFAGGTVPGKGSGKVDTVPAMLAPHEAVLNRAAADKLGRGKIAALNQQGVKKMGTGRGMPMPMKKA